jgi:hypothetical protein
LEFRDGDRNLRSRSVGCLLRIIVCEYHLAALSPRRISRDQRLSYDARNARWNSVLRKNLWGISRTTASVRRRRSALLRDMLTLACLGMAFPGHTPIFRYQTSFNRRSCSGLFCTVSREPARVTPYSSIRLWPGEPRADLIRVRSIAQEEEELTWTLHEKLYPLESGCED